MIQHWDAEQSNFIPLRFFRVHRGIAIMRGFKTAQEARAEIKRRGAIEIVQIKADQALGELPAWDITAEEMPEQTF